MFADCHGLGAFVLNPRVLLANRVDLGSFCFTNFIVLY